MTRRAATLLLAAYLALVAIATAAVHAATDRASSQLREIGHGQIRFAGAGPERWALRFRRQRRVANTLRTELGARLDRIVWLVTAFECVHGYEGAWNANTGNGYAGGLQFGPAEWQRYGGTYAPTADTATPAQQIAAAIGYHAAAGFYPWPNTARMCGLLR
jgi:hypothetical protein